MKKGRPQETLQLRWPKGYPSRSPQCGDQAKFRYRCKALISSAGQKTGRLVPSQWSQKKYIVRMSTHRRTQNEEHNPF